MSTPQQKIQPRQIELSSQPSTSSSTPFSTATAAEPLPLAGLKASSFWVQKGMSTFFDWLTDPDNYVRLTNKNPLPGQTRADVHQEIAKLVNEKHGTEWTESQVKSKIMYAKKLYREAAALNSTGGGVLEKQEEICPLFNRLHAIFADSLSLAPRLRESGVRPWESASLISSEEDSDLEGSNNISDTDASALLPNKRRKKERMEFKIHQISGWQHNKNEHDVRSRERAIALREVGFAERMIQLRDEANRELEKLRALFREEMASERSEIRQDRADLRQDRADLRRDREEFKKERDDLKTENAELKKELSLRLAKTQ